MVGSSSFWCQRFVHRQARAVMLADMRLAGGRAGAFLRPVLGLGLVATIFSFLGWSLASNWSDLRSEDIDVQPALLAVSAVPFIVATVLQALIWRLLVQHLDRADRPGLAQLPKVFLYSWVGRYVPGKIAYVAGRMFLGRSVGFSMPVLAGSMGYEMVLLLAAGSAFATVTVLPSVAVESETIWPYLALPALAIGALVALHPRTLRLGMRIGARVFGREDLQLDWILSQYQIARFSLLYLLVFCLVGVSFYLLVISITPYPLRYLPLAAGTFALAGVVGLVSVVTPAGIGVREGVIVAVLQITMPLELAILISLVARVWATVVDLLIVGGVLAFDYFSGERMLAAALRGNADEVET